MSLLMDALRRAEEAKRKGERNPAEAALSGSPPAFPGSRLPELSQHIDAVDADLASIAKQHEAMPAFPPSRPPVPDPRDTAERTATRNVFSAKHSSGPNTGPWLLIGSGILAAILIGGYFWWQLQGIASGSRMQGPSPQPSQRMPAPDPSLELRGDTAGPLSPGKPPAAISSASIAPPLPEESKIRPSQAQRPPTPSPAAPRAALPESPVRLSKTTPRTNPLLERAYDALLAGRTDDAQHDYEQVLRNDARNTDALLGLATLAAQRGQTEGAHAYYLRALESDPSDATAQAGIISTRGLANADLSESRLKTALSGQPDSPALHFALGNLYARQGRWGEAQQSYFQAYAIEPDNADFIFNLAVSLDHLNQNKLAVQYYRMALSTAGTRAASFDKAQADRRIFELQP